MQNASFGFVVSGAPVVYDTMMAQQQCDPTNQTVTARWSYTLNSFPATIWLFLTGNAPLPEGKVLSMYIAEFRGDCSTETIPFLYLGHVGQQCPSGKFIVPSGNFYSQFASTVSGQQAMVLGFSLEDETCAQQQASAVALPSIQAHEDLVMRIGSTITQSFSQCIQQCGSWLPGSNPNGSDATVVVPTRAIDKCQEMTSKNIERNTLYFSSFS